MSLNSYLPLLKIVNNGDCFRLSRFPSSYADLEEMIRAKFEHHRLPENFCFKYEDSDRDSINLETQSDFEAFQEFVLQERLSTVKIRIDTKSYKQYFSGSTTANATTQQQPVNYLTQQILSAGTALINPFLSMYQNIQSCHYNITNQSFSISNKTNAVPIIPLNATATASATAGATANSNLDQIQSTLLASLIQLQNSIQQQQQQQSDTLKQPPSPATISTIPCIGNSNGATALQSNATFNRNIQGYGGGSVGGNGVGGGSSDFNNSINFHLRAPSSQLSSFAQIPLLSKRASEVNQANNQNNNNNNQNQINNQNNAQNNNNNNNTTTAPQGQVQGQGGMLTLQQKQSILMMTPLASANEIPSDPVLVDPYTPIPQVINTIFNSDIWEGGFLCGGGNGAICAHGGTHHITGVNGRQLLTPFDSIFEAQQQEGDELGGLEPNLSINESIVDANEDTRHHHLHKFHSNCGILNNPTRSHNSGGSIKLPADHHSNRAGVNIQTKQQQSGVIPATGEEIEYVQKSSPNWNRASDNDFADRERNQEIHLFNGNAKKQQLIDRFDTTDVAAAASFKDGMSAHETMNYNEDNNYQGHTTDDDTVSYRRFAEGRESHSMQGGRERTSRLGNGNGAASVAAAAGENNLSSLFHSQSQSSQLYQSQRFGFLSQISNATQSLASSSNTVAIVQGGGTNTSGGLNRGDSSTGGIAMLPSTQNNNATFSSQAAVPAVPVVTQAGINIQQDICSVTTVSVENISEYPPNRNSSHSNSRNQMFKLRDSNELISSENVLSSNRNSFNFNSIHANNNNNNNSSNLHQKDMSVAGSIESNDLIANASEAMEVTNKFEQKWQDSRIHDDGMFVSFNVSNQSSNQQQVLEPLPLLKCSSSMQMNEVSEGQSRGLEEETVYSYVCVKNMWRTYKDSSSQGKLRMSMSMSMQSHRAKLMQKICLFGSGLNEGTVMVYLEIQNSGFEDWPKSVYLRSISGVTDKQQYVISSNVGVMSNEITSVAFPIRNAELQATAATAYSGFKTVWRLYSIEENNPERKFFGPKITIDLQDTRSKLLLSYQDASYSLKGSSLQSKYLGLEKTGAIVKGLLRQIFDKKRKADLLGSEIYEYEEEGAIEGGDNKECDQENPVERFVDNSMGLIENYRKSLLDPDSQFSISFVTLKFIKAYILAQNTSKKEKTNRNY